LKAAREAAGLDQAPAGELAALSEGTVRNWEKARGKGDWARSILYLAVLASRSRLAARFVLQILGLRENEIDQEDDDQVIELLERLRRARASDPDWAVKREMVRLIFPEPPTTKPARASPRRDRRAAEA
jgi:hypothetical protein